MTDWLYSHDYKAPKYRRKRSMNEEMKEIEQT